MKQLKIETYGKILVTPDMAARWLAATAAHEERTGERVNRPISSSRVALFECIIAADEWRCTHQGVLLGYRDIVIDGQHRLTSLCASKKSLEMYVSSDESLTSALHVPVDMNVQPRTKGFVLDINKRIIQVVNILLGLANQGKGAVGLGRWKPTSSTEVERAAAIVLAVKPQLPSSTRRLFSTATVRAMAYLAMLQYPQRAEDIAEQYCALVHSDVTKLWPITNSFSMQIMSAAVARRAMNRTEVSERAYRVFTCEPARRDITKMTIRSHRALHREMTDAASSALGIAQPAARPISVAS